MKLPKSDAKVLKEGWELTLPNGDGKLLLEGWDGND